MAREATVSTSPIHIRRRQPARGAIQPVRGAARTPIAAAGDRNSNEDAVADMPKPASGSWLNTTTVKLMAAKTPVSVATVVATIGQIWRDFRCFVLMSAWARHFSTYQKT